MPSLRPHLPGKEPVLPPHVLSTPSGIRRQLNISTISRPYFILVILTAICIVFFVFYRRKGRRNTVLTQSFICPSEELLAKAACGYKKIIPQPYIPLQAHKISDQILCNPDYHTDIPPITSYTSSLRPCTETSDSGAFASSSSGSTFVSETSSRYPPPPPTIRRHSCPLDQTTDPETMVASYHDTFGHDRISGYDFNDSAFENTASSKRAMKVPRPWVPGRTDTVVSLNGCRRHVMTIEGDPYRRASAG